MKKPYLIILLLAVLLTTVPQLTIADPIIDSTGGPYVILAGDFLTLMWVAHDTDGSTLSSTWAVLNQSFPSTYSMTMTILWAELNWIPHNYTADFTLTVENSTGVKAWSTTTLTIYDPWFVPVPEPSIMVLLGISMMSLAGLRRWWKD